MRKVKITSEQSSFVPNPAGREGKPLSLAPLTTEEALRKMLAVKPEKLAALKKSAKKAREMAAKKG